MTTNIPVYVVFGASAGIGSALCRQLMNHGAALVLAARDSDRLQALGEELRAEFFPPDVLDFRQVDACCT